MPYDISGNTATPDIPQVGDVPANQALPAMGETPEVNPDDQFTDPAKASPSSWDQLGGMLSSGNPVMQAADTKGKQQAAQGGLLHSSLAGQASQAAMVDAAQPFALQDASNAAGLLADRQAMDLAVEKEQRMTSIMREQGAPEWMFNVMNSEMSGDQKDFLMETFYPQGVAGIDYGEGGSPVLGSGKDNLDWSNYTAVKDEFDDEYAAFIGDAKAREQWRTETPTGDQSKAIAKGMGFQKDIRHKDRYLADRTTIRKIVDRYGSWDNAERAAKMWLGSGNYGKDELRDIILAGLG
jgi:hypothetical protein